jgi:hypothetical protein
MKVLILSPHIDDAFLSLGGFIAKYFSLHDLEVLDIFSYDPWVLGDSEIADKLKNIEVRKKEEILNASIVGIKVNFLDFPAGWKERGYPRWQMNIDRKRDHKILNQISRYLEKLAGSFDLIFSPLGIGGHVDHKLIREIASKLFKSKVYYYEDQPYALEKNFFRCSKNFQKKQRLLSYVLSITKKELKIKEMFVGNYKSQLTKEEMKMIIKYSQGSFEQKVSKTSSEIIWTYKDNIKILSKL